MSDDKSYESFLTDMGGILKQSMPGMDRERDLLEAAEAEVHRLKMQLASAEERQEVLRERYRRARGVFMEMFDTWKSECLKLKAPDEDMGELVTEYMGGVEGETPVRMIPELGTATLAT